MTSHRLIYVYTTSVDSTLISVIDFEVLHFLGTFFIKMSVLRHY